MSPAKFDATGIHDIAVGEPSSPDRIVAAEGRHQAGGYESRPRSATHHDNVQATAAVLREASDRRELQLTLTDSHEDEGAPISARLTVEFQLDGERAHSPEQSQRGDHGRQPIAEAALEALAGAHEHDVGADGARVQKDAPVDGCNVGCGRHAVRGQLGGLHGILRDAVVLGKVIERSAGYDGERGFFSDERRGGFCDGPVTARDDDSLGALTHRMFDLTIELLRITWGDLEDADAFEGLARRLAGSRREIDEGTNLVTGHERPQGEKRTRPWRFGADARA